ncbi:MAG: hypothetical protein RIB60_09535 [Phycisphaerales bacterium]
MGAGRSSMKAIALRVFLASVGVTALAAIGAVLFDGLSLSEPVLISSFVFAIHALGVLIAAILGQRRAARLSAAASSWVLIAAGLGWLALVWLEHFGIMRHPPDTILRLLGTAETFAVVALVHALTLWPERPAPVVRLLRYPAWGSATAAGLVLTTIFWFESLWVSAGDWSWKLFAIFLILSTASTIGLFVTHRLRREDLDALDDTGMDRRVPVALTCPRCGAAASIRANTRDACGSCGLRLRVEFEEPRCACGYLLHGLTGDTCPECGRPISEHRPWASASTAARSASDAPARTPPTSP